eukprot:6146428-Pyramimonas_sp.AAC.1
MAGRWRPEVKAGALAESQPAPAAMGRPPKGDEFDGPDAVFKDGLDVAAARWMPLLDGPHSG